MPKDRPAWWNPDQVLERLRGGERPMALCKVVEFNHEVSYKQAYNDITVWRKQVDGFDEAYQAIVRQTSPGTGGGGTRAEVPPSWETLWLKAWAATGMPLTACDVVEKEIGFRPSYATIRAKINPKNAAYDEDFHERYKEAEELVIGARVEDLFGCVSDPKTAPRDRAYIDLQILERRRPLEWGRNSKIQHEGTVTHEHGPSPQLMARFNNLVEGRFDRYTPKQIEGVIEGEVIEEAG